MFSDKMYSKSLVLLILSCTTFAIAQWTPDPFCPYPSDHVTRYPYYGNCSVYWECFDGTKYVMECPEGLEFNAPLQQCDTPSIANCDPYASTTANPNPPTYSTGTTSSDGPHPVCPFPSNNLTYYPYPGDCTKYWECFQGDSYLYTCPEGLWWHESISQCDYPGDFCSNSSEPPTEGTTGTTDEVTTFGPDPSCPYPSENITFFPYPADCTKYYMCFEGIRYIEDCPDGLWWHEEISECDYPGDFCGKNTPNTSEGTTPSTTEGTETTDSTSSGGTNPPDPTTCPSDSSDDVTYFPYPGDCTKFWECYDGTKYESVCPSGLWWHNEIKKCDAPGDYCNY